MIRKLALCLILLLGISGCSSLAVNFDSGHPGELSIAGGQLQLLFSNPEYTDLNPNDPLAQREILQSELFGKANGAQNVTGGVGMMQIWRF